MNHATALSIVDKIIANLQSRRGFDEAFDIDGDIMGELREDLAGIVSQQWKPIDSAPIETSVLAFDNGRIYIAEWYEVDGEPYWQETVEYIPIQPTHWMPLPEPPKD